MAVLGSPSLIILMAAVDAKQHLKKKKKKRRRERKKKRTNKQTAPELCECRGGCLGLTAVHNCPYNFYIGLCGRKSTLDEDEVGIPQLRQTISEFTLWTLQVLPLLLKRPSDSGVRNNPLLPARSAARGAESEQLLRTIAVQIHAPVHNLIGLLRVYRQRSWSRVQVNVSIELSLITSFARASWRTF